MEDVPSAAIAGAPGACYRAGFRGFFVMTVSRSSIVVACLLGLALSACNNTADSSPARKERVLANLKLKFPMLGNPQLSATVGDFKRVAKGMDLVEISVTTPRGPQVQKVLVSTDDKVAYLAGEGPIDLSKNETERKAEEDKAAQEQAKAKVEQDKSAAERKVELAKVAERYQSRGNAGAKVTIVEFSDFQCPYCKRGAATLEEVLKKFPNDVRLVFVDYPLPFHPWAKPAAIAAICAAKQDPAIFWKLYEQYFANQETINPENVLARTQQFLGGSKVNAASWKKCATETTSAEYQAVQKQVEESVELGKKFGVDGTPAFFINGDLLTGAQPAEQFEQAIRAALAKG
jgi:protein-disulfide isomerase